MSELSNDLTNVCPLVSLTSGWKGVYNLQTERLWSMLRSAMFQVSDENVTPKEVLPNLKLMALKNIDVSL